MSRFLHEGAFLHEDARDIPVADEYDVIVCGGGTAGIPAAIAAARRGARVALFERYGFVGGVAAFSIMPCWHCLPDHHSGLLTEFAQRVANFHQGPDPLRDAGHIEPETVKIVALEMLLEAGVELHLHSWVCDVVKDENRVRGIITQSKSGRRAFLSKVLIDATGDGDVCALAGADFLRGDNGKMQGMSLRFRIGHINFEKYFDWIADNRQYFKDINNGYLQTLRDKALRGEAFFLPGNLSELFRAHGGDDAHLPEHSYFNCSSIRPNELSLNVTRVYGLDGTREEDLTRAEIITRRQSYAVWRFLRAHVPGFEYSMIVDVAPQIGVRESREIVGDYILTEDDCRQNREFDDAILTAKIHFDVHDVSGYILEWVKGVVDVPYRCLLPRGLENLLVVGRCMSTDHIANSTTRLQEIAYRTGQAGGTAAALAALQNISPRALPFSQLQNALHEDGFVTSQAQRYQREKIIAQRSREERMQSARN